MSTETEYGYKIPELEDKDFWTAYNFNFNRLDSHSHDGDDSAPILLANQTQDEDNRLVTDDEKVIWNTHTHDGGDTPHILLAGQTQDSSNRLVTDAQIAQWDGALPFVESGEFTATFTTNFAVDEEVTCKYSRVGDTVVLRIGNAFGIASGTTDSQTVAFGAIPVSIRPQSSSVDYGRYVLRDGNGFNIGSTSVIGGVNISAGGNLIMDKRNGSLAPTDWIPSQNMGWLDFTITYFLT